MLQAWAGIPVPKLFLLLFFQFFPKLGWEHCFWFPFPIPTFGNTVFHSHSQSQLVNKFIGKLKGNHPAPSLKVWPFIWAFFISLGRLQPLENYSVFPFRPTRYFLLQKLLLLICLFWYSVEIRVMLSKTLKKIIYK